MLCQSRESTEQYDKFQGLLNNKNDIQKKEVALQAERQAKLNQSLTILLDVPPLHKSIVSRPFRKVFHSNTLLDPNRTVSQQMIGVRQQLTAATVGINTKGCNTIEMDDSQLSKEQFQQKYLRFYVFVQSHVRGNKLRKSVVKTKKNYRHRFNVINELINTEKTYVSDLSVIIDNMIPAASLILPGKTIETLFGNIKSLYGVNKGLLDQINEIQLSDWRYLFRVAQVLIATAPYFKLYSEYYRAQGASQALFKDLKKTDTKFSDLLKESQKNSALRGLGWDGFLIKPIQRLPKYELLIRDFLKHTESDHPLNPIFNDALNQFTAVIQQNDSKLSQFWQELQMQDLQRLYGQPNQLQLIDPSRRLLKEEKLSLIVDSSTEVKVLAYFLSDMILLCDKDQNETEYRLLKHVKLSDQSICSAVPDKRFVINLCKLVAQNQSLFFSSETPELRDKLVNDITAILTELGMRQSNQLQKRDVLEISVEVKGTEEREKNMFGAYTVYVIEISIGKVYFKVDLRYSELKAVDEWVGKELGDIKLPRLTGASLLNNKDAKVIESRKLEIEELILHLLLNETFISKDALFKGRVLSMLKLDINFYDFPNLLKDQQQNPEMRKTLQQDRIPASLLTKMSTRQSTERQTVKHKSVVGSAVTVKFHDETKQDFQINEQTRASELIQIIAESLDLGDVYDFKLFEIDEGRMRSIMDDELVLQLTKKILKNKSLLFRKYLFLPTSFEDDQVSNNSRRIQLLTFQNFFEIAQGNLPLQQSDYCLVSALYLLIQSSRNYDLLSKLIPSTAYKSLSKAQWQDSISKVSTTLNMNMIQYIDYQLEEFGQTNTIVQESFAQRFENCQNHSIRAGMLLQQLVSQHPLYGVTCFQVAVTKDQKQKLQKIFVERDCDKIQANQFILGISYDGFHFVEEGQKRQICKVNYSEVKEFKAFQEMFVLQITQNELKFQTGQGFQIQSLVEEYCYLRKQIGK